MCGHMCVGTVRSVKWSQGLTSKASIRANISGVTKVVCVTCAARKQSAVLDSGMRGAAAYTNTGTQPQPIVKICTGAHDNIYNAIQLQQARTLPPVVPSPHALLTQTRYERLLDPPANDMAPGECQHDISGFM